MLGLPPMSGTKGRVLDRKKLGLPGMNRVAVKKGKEMLVN